MRGPRTGILSFMNSRFLRFACAALGVPAAALASDWTHIMGPSINRKSAEAAPAWDGKAPRKVWEIPAEGGFSSFVTGDGKAYTVVAADGRETVIAVDRQTGKKLWETKLAARTHYDRGGDRGVPGNDGGDGPRATPVFAGGQVFVFGAEFDLYALKSATGEVVWKKDLLKDFGGRQIDWSNAATPLVLRDRVIVAGGGANQSHLAFRTDTGAVLWKSGSYRATHSTPIVTTIHGKEQVLFMTDRGVVSRDPADGKELWLYPFPFSTSVAASPVVWNDIVNCTAGYGVGGGACQVTLKDGKWEVTELWRSPGNRETASHWSTAVALDGYLYGCYGHNQLGGGPLKCIDIRTGKVMWQKPGFGHGQVILTRDNKIIAVSDAGVLAFIDPSPDAYKEIARSDVLDGKVWSSPALSDGQLFLRSTTEGVCLAF
jgi:outer membrane protein assembly factor BamB